jgi:hypothetical protein
MVVEFGDKFRAYADSLREDDIDGATLDDPDLNIDNVLSDLNVKKEVHKSKLKRGLNALRLSGTQRALAISKTEKIATAVDSAANEGEDGVEAFESKLEESTANASEVIEPLQELGAMRMCDDLSKSDVDNDQGPTYEASTNLLNLSGNSAPRHGTNVQTNVAELDLMVVARSRLEQDLKAVMADPCEDEAKKCSTSMVNVGHVWGETKKAVLAAAMALDKRVKAGDTIGSAESAIEFTQITRAILVELRTLTSTLKKMGKRIAAIKEKKVLKALKSTLEAAQQDLKGEAAALKKRLASNPEAIRILVEAREHLVRDCEAFMASPGEESWEGCALHLRMLVDSWAMVRRAIVAAVEELRGKASDKEVVGAAKSAVTFAQLLRGAVIELLELMNELRGLKQQVVEMEGGMKGVVEAALDTARDELKGLRTVLMQTSAEHILEAGELQQLKAEAAVDEGGALLDFAEMMVNSVSMLPIPGLGSVCAMLSGAVGAAQKVHELASDALEMTQSMFEIGRYMIDLQRLAMRMKQERKVELELHMGNLAELIGEMRGAIQAFGQRGFLTKMMGSAKVVRRLATIERRKEATLKAMDRILQTAQTELLLDVQDRVPLETKEHTYALVEAVWSKVEERTKANGGDVDVEADVSEAAEEIMRSPADMKEVADRAGLSEESFKEEMALVLAAVKEGFEEVKVEMKEIKDTVQEEAGQTREEIKGAVQEIQGAVSEIKGAMTEIKGVAGMAISTSDTIQDEMRLLTVAHSPRQEASTDGAATVLVGATAGKFIEVLWCFLRLFLTSISSDVSQGIYAKPCAPTSTPTC